MAKYAHYRTSVPGRVPEAADVAVGEIVMNTADRVLYTKTEGGEIVRVAADSYTRTEMEQRYVPQGILPVTRFGDLTVAALPTSLLASSIDVLSDIPVLLSGRTYTLAVGAYSFAAAIVGNVGAATLNVYLTLSNAQATLEYSLASLPETVVRVFIGTIALSDQTASNLQLTKVSRLDIYRPSLNKAGSSFPVSPGTPNQISQTNW